MNSAQRLCSYELERAINKEMSFKEHLKIIESTTSEDIMEIAKRIFCKENIVTVICRGEDDA